MHSRGCAAVLTDSPEGCSWVRWQRWSVFLRNLHAGFHSGCSSFHSRQPAGTGVLSSRPLQHLSLAFGFHLLRQALKMDPRRAQDSWQPPYHSLICFLDDSQSDWVSENLSVVLTCISLQVKRCCKLFSSTIGCLHFFENHLSSPYPTSRSGILTFNICSFNIIVIITFLTYSWKIPFSVP